MEDATKRTLGYPLAAFAVAVLVWCGLYESTADFGTLIGSATIHAQQASRISTGSARPEGAEIRDRLLDDAEDWLDRAEEVRAGTAVARETRAYIASLRGDHAAAARLYAEAIELPDCAPEQHGGLILNRAAALSNAGDHSGAVSLLDRSQGRLRASEIARSRVLEVHALARRGDSDEARRRALSFAEADHTEASDLLCAAALLEDLEDWEAAETVYRRAEDDPATMNYYLARLKIRVGQFDSALELLKRATDSSRSTVARLLQRDRALWGDCADDERFRSLTEPEGETAVPGR